VLLLLVIQMGSIRQCLRQQQPLSGKQGPKAALPASLPMLLRPSQPQQPTAPTAAAAGFCTVLQSAVLQMGYSGWEAAAAGAASILLVLPLMAAMAQAPAAVTAAAAVGCSVGCVCAWEW
jgi:hypothetical protein